MKALALLSGGLDSTLAIKVLLDQGIEVEAINFTSPFCLCGGAKGGCHAAAAAADRLGIRLHREACGQGYLDTIARPRYGYGRRMNPCLDCRIYKLNRAKERMADIGASFLVTGEVLDQRPMSQRRDTLDICERDTGLRGLILRPLSARFLRPTKPELEGWVDRARLLSIRGRGRGPQIALARSLGVTDYPCPGGGCLLTYAGFAAKVRDLLDRGERLTPWSANLLRIGRHLRLPGGIKLVVGRREEENERLLYLAAAGTTFLESSSHPGPSALACGLLDGGSLLLAAAVVARYADPSPGETACLVSWRYPEKTGAGAVTVAPLPAARVAQWLIGSEAAAGRSIPPQRASC
ncbi:MAG: hypothetical protein ACM3X6_01010 [Patescibacteria group bacterium]